MDEATRVQTIIDDGAVGLWYHPGPGIVHHQLRSFVYGRQFRAVLERGLELCETRGARKWLSDDRGNGPLRPDDADWALNSWAPRMMALGWKYWAVVLPDKVLGQMNMRRWMEAYAEQGVTVEVFANPDQAMAWLEQVEE